MKLTSLGKLSSKGPRRPFGYQMKWPMPSDAKSSPWFHAVSPEIVPLHSFCQTLFPIFRASPCENVMAHDMCGQSAIVAATSHPARKQKPLGSQQRCFLDGRHLSISVRLSAAINYLKRRGKNHLMKRFILIVSASLIALPLFGQREITATKRPEGQGQL